MLNIRRSLAVLPMISSSVLAQDKPNIIFVLVDDMGWGDMSAYQKKYTPSVPRLSTPSLDMMAKSGVQLTRHYTAAPVSAPARASLFTGLHQGQEQVVRNNNFDAPIEDTDTLADVLSEAGYRTALIGKWGVGGGREGGGTPKTSPAWPTKRGFDYFFGYHNHLTAHRHYPVEEPNADPDTNTNAVWDNDTNITSQLAGCYSTDLFIARAKKWIIDERANHPDQPFFLALTLTAPHARLSLPALPYPKGGGLKGGVQWTGNNGKMINTASPETWDTYYFPSFAKQKDWPDYAKRHATIIKRIDQGMGDLVKLLKDLNIDKNTYIVFTSDNGPHNEAGGVQRISDKHPHRAQNPSFFRSYGITDGIKRDVWEGGLRVPCIVYAPSLIKSGSTNDHPSQFHDWMATFADIAGIAEPVATNGRSLLPLLTGKKQLQDNIVYTEYRGNSPMAKYPHFADNKKGRPRADQQAFYFRDSSGKLLKAIRTGIQTGNEPFEVYDTKTDPQETRNLADKLPDGTQDKLRAFYLQNRIPYQYQPKINSGKRVYDPFAIPALTTEQLGKKKRVEGLSIRQIQPKQLTSWVPRFGSICGATKAPAQLLARVSDLKLPAGSVTELTGYITIPAEGKYKLQVKGNKQTTSYIQIHNINETLANHLHLSAGMHPITITLRQGDTAADNISIEWTKDKKGIVPDSGFSHNEG